MSRNQLPLRPWATVAVLVLVTLAAGGSEAQGRSTLQLGFTDRDAFQTGDPAGRAAAYANVRRSEGSIVRLIVDWGVLVTAPPPTRDAARDPAFPGYDWSATDSSFRDATAAGLDVLAIVGGAPSWAEGPDRPAGDAGGFPGSWMPSPDALGDFAQAIARRYSGRFPDPSAPGRALPRVRLWQVWNEPNLTSFLAPQWRDGRPFAPARYRELLNAAYAGFKAAGSGNVVLMGGMGPYGDFGQGRRTMPARFFRELLCLDGDLRRRQGCEGVPVLFDVLTHHPYSVSPPLASARNADDVTIPDLGRLTRILRAAARARTVDSARKPLWITEYSFDTRPPDPDGVPERLAAEYVSQALHQFWSAGASAVIWYLLRDDPPRPSFDTTVQGGLFRRGATVADDRPKLTWRAFRFPFVGYGRGSRARVWGRSPLRGRVTIEVRRRGQWRHLRTLSTRNDGVFQGSVRVRRGSTLRARVGRRARSLTFAVRALAIER